MQNRNKLIKLFISNLTNAIVHKMLERAIRIEDIAKKYRKEIINSWEISKKYREKINPIKSRLPDKDVSYIKRKIISRVKKELLLRISKGYENIDINLVESLVEDALKEMFIS